jgi:pyrroloquinoline-quinone synthase
MPLCLVCEINSNDWYLIAKHIYDLTRKNDSKHIMWLNRNLSLKELSIEELAKRLEEFFSIKNSLALWTREIYSKILW